MRKREYEALVKKYEKKKNKLYKLAIEFMDESNRRGISPADCAEAMKYADEALELANGFAQIAGEYQRRLDCYVKGRHNQ